jgi:hypothetical protein
MAIAARRTLPVRPSDADIDGQAHVSSRRRQLHQPRHEVFAPARPCPGAIDLIGRRYARE